MVLTVFMSVVQEVMLVLSITLAAISANLRCALFSQLRLWGSWRRLYRGGGCLSFGGLRHCWHTTLLAIMPSNS